MGNSRRGRQAATVQGASYLSGISVSMWEVNQYLWTIAPSLIAGTVLIFTLKMISGGLWGFRIGSVMKSNSRRSSCSNRVEETTPADFLPPSQSKVYPVSPRRFLC
jgi:hypothetical protein